MDPHPPSPAEERLISIDALRGFDMFWIVGGEELVKAIARLSNSRAGRVVQEQLDHVEWEGFRFYDLIFPLFLFLVGVVLPFSLSKTRSLGRKTTYRRVFKRTVLLFVLGLLYYGFLQFDWANLRVAGVLQRIALCYGITAIIFLNTKTLGRVFLLTAILLGYWTLLANVAPPGGKAGDYSKEGNLAGWVDRNYLPGRIFDSYYGFGDNEGLLSTIPALGTSLLGVFAGTWLRTKRGPWTKAIGLLVAGVVSAVAGYAWAPTFPIIKNIWTSSFVLVAGGFSLVLLALFYAVIDVLRFRRWAFFFVVIGSNAITIYCLQRVIDFDKIAKFFFGGVYRLASNHGAASLSTIISAVGVLAVEWLLLIFLYRNRLFLRV